MDLPAQKRPCVDDGAHLFGFGNPDHKPSKLQKIVQHVEEALPARKEAVPLEDLKRQVAGIKPLDLRTRLADTDPRWKGMALLAEFKRASPSKGPIAMDKDVAEQTQSYAAAGAAVLSVLTEPAFFKGSLEDMQKARKATEAQTYARPAVLRKDFVIDEYQIYEALAYGADTVLLMVSILRASQISHLIEVCTSLGITPLVEVVSADELRVALKAGATVIGVNNRNLHTFELDLKRTDEIASLVDLSEIRLLALSGIAAQDEVRHYRKIGVAGVLVGEALMRTGDTSSFIEQLMDPEIKADSGVVVKVCGVREPADATLAMESGANLIGLIFAESKRKVGVDQAQKLVAQIRAFGERTARPEQLKPLAGRGDEDFLCRMADVLRHESKRTPLAVGVFLDATVDEVVAAYSESGVDIVQLHGKESPEYIGQLRERCPGICVVKVVHIKSDPSQQAVAERIGEYRVHADFLLLDTSVGSSASGGTGQTFDWKILDFLDKTTTPVLVAGGLTDTNVGDLVTNHSPFGVDVSSGIESAPAVKDHGKTSRYVKNAHKAAADAVGATILV